MKETPITPEALEKLVSLAYEANNHARRLLNTHDTNNERDRKKIDDRAKYLAEHYADNGGFKIVQSSDIPITEDAGHTSEQIFNQSDMREAFYQGMDHQNIPWKYFGFDEWIEGYKDEREQR